MTSHIHVFHSLNQFLSALLHSARLDALATLPSFASRAKLPALVQAVDLKLGRGMKQICNISHSNIQSSATCVKGILSCHFSWTV